MLLRDTPNYFLSLPDSRPSIPGQVNVCLFNVGVNVVDVKNGELKVLGILLVNGPPASLDELYSWISVPLPKNNENYLQNCIACKENDVS